MWQNLILVLDGCQSTPHLQIKFDQLTCNYYRLRNLIIVSDHIGLNKVHNYYGKMSHLKSRKTCASNIFIIRTLFVKVIGISVFALGLVFFLLGDSISNVVSTPNLSLGRVVYSTEICTHRDLEAWDFFFKVHIYFFIL